MRLTEEKLKSLLRSQTARSTPRQRECLGPDQFLRAASGEMNSEERRATARHLITCTDCTDEYQVLRSLKPWAEEFRTTDSPAVDVPVSPTRPLLRIVENSPSLTRRERLVTSIWRSRTGLAVAASLLISLALGSWLLVTKHADSRQIAQLTEQLTERERTLAVAEESLDQTRRRLEETGRRAQEKTADDAFKQAVARHQEEIADLRRTINQIGTPQLDVPIIDLDPSEATRGNVKEVATRVEIPPTANLITLILNFSHKQHTRYAIELFDQLGKRVWRGEQPQKGESRSVNVTLSRQSVPAGLYVIKLYGLNGTRELIGNYAVQIEK